MYKLDNIRLVPFTEKDIEDPYYRSWFTDQEVTKYNSHGLFPQTEKALKSFVEGLGSERLVLKILVTGTWIGNVSLQSFNWINRSAELAIIIGSPITYKKGIGTIACKLIIAHGFEKMNLNRIWTGTSATNTGMQNVALRCGMKPEGNSREGMFLENKYVNVFHYGIIRSDYESIKKDYFSDTKSKIKEQYPLDGSVEDSTGSVPHESKENTCENKS